jgi:hypothetical protein
LVGDSSRGGWYSAGEFGDGKLFNSDVNNAYFASFGIRVPYDFTDAFDAMDVGRPGRPDFLGGDGTITSYDWQVLYLRSLGLDTNNWARTSARDSDGVHLSIYPTNGNFIAADIRPDPGASKKSNPAEADVLSPGPGAVWLRNAVVGAGSLANVVPGNTYSFPVYVKVTPGYSLASLQFRATLLPQSDAPTPGQIQFVNPIGANFSQFAGTSSNDLVCSWAQVPSSAFNPKLQGSNLLGYIQFQVPGNALAGQSYKLRFSYTDGAPDLNTFYELENLSGYAWVLGATQNPENISEQWKTCFFGSTTNALADDNADADGDGFSNLQEYEAGTNPTNALSRLQFSRSDWRNNGGQRSIALEWLTAPGKTYVVECAPALTSPTWSGILTNIGDGNSWEFIHTNVNNNTQFYRIRLKP